MYDIFYVSKGKGKEDIWKKIKSKYPSSQRLSNIRSYHEIKEQSFTKMFWVIWDDLDIQDSFDLTSYRATKWDDMYVHVFKNGEYYDGICLFPKHVNISNREFENRFFIEKKEVDIIASIPLGYDKFEIDTYEDYLAAVEKSMTEMFWVIWKDVEISKDFSFDYRVPVYDQHVIHVFKNSQFYDGICLFPKSTIVTKREFQHRFFVNKKEINLKASTPRPFKKYKIKTYDDYLRASTDTDTDMFWGVFDDLIVEENFNFDYYVPVYDSFHRNITHVFLNGEHFDGICLFSKKTLVSKKELDYRFYNNKKEIDIKASIPSPYDVVFISYHEKFADKNYQKIKNHLLPGQNLYRIDGIKGIHNAHKAAAEKVSTPMFWVIDADAILLDNFKFDYQVICHNQDMVHVWRSRNPVNNLEYGNGGVKLLPRNLTLEVDENTPDMTTSISKKFKAMDTVSNINAFNVDEFSTWRSAFRECCKLASRVIERQYEEETQNRLETWCTVGKDKPFGKYAINGALLGKAYGLENKDNPEALAKINDFEWLRGMFNNDI